MEVADRFSANMQLSSPGVSLIDRRANQKGTMKDLLSLVRTWDGVR